jgi:hypothetical protein
VNSLLATQYPALAQLGEQLDVSPDTAATTRWRAQLYDIAPSVAAAWRHNNDRARFHADFARRNDYIRNGVGLDTEGRISPVSADLDAFAASIERGDERNETGPAQVSPELVERLERTVWQADQLQAFLRHVLTEWELLSTEECDWHDANERSGPAADSKWQVIVTPKVNSLDANGRHKVMWVPERFSRTLLQQVPSGGLPVSAHELAHVLQTEADEELATHLPLAGIKGRRSITMKEMGAVFQEGKVQAYFGNRRPVNTTYLRALQAKLAGRNNTEVARAFVEARRLTHPNGSEQAAAKSGNVATRLNRHDGFDSQPLDYLVQGYLIKCLRSQMSEDALAVFSIAATGFSLSDTARLRAADLFEIPKSLRFRPAETVIRCYFEEFDRP